VAERRAAVDGGNVVGREDELEQLARFVETHAVSSGALLLEGAAGIGKTTLWREGLRLLDASGFRILRAAPAASEATLSYSGLTDLLAPVYHLVRVELPAPQRRALDGALALEESAGTPDEGDRLIRAGTLGALRELSELGPLALAVDDIQWLDAESVDALTYALRRLEDTPILCLLALRLDAPAEFDVNQLGVLPTQRLSVGPLSLGATQRLLLQELDVTYPRPVIRRLVETSGGNPFYALELARGLERGGRDVAEPLALSQSLEALVAERLDAVSPSASRLLGLLSLVPEASVSLLERLNVLGSLDEVVAAGVVVVSGGVARFDHPLLAAGASGRLGPEERRGFHEALACTLEDPIDRARHLAEATVGTSAERAAQVVLGGTTAGSRGLSAVAAELLAEAVRMTPDDDPVKRGRLLLEAEFRARSGSFERAGELLDEVIPIQPRGHDLARALRIRAMVTGDIARQRELLLRALDETDDPATRSETNALLVRNYLYTGELEDALAAARAADEEASRTHDPVRVAAATTTRGLMEIWGTGEPDREVFARACEFARAGDDLPSDTYSNPHTLIGARGLYRYELDVARTSYLVAASAAELAGDVDSLETFWWGLAQVEARAGRYAHARDYVDRIVESADSDVRRALSVIWIEGVLATFDGRVDEARGALHDALARAEGGQNWFFVAYTRSALALLELSLGRPENAVSALDPVLSTPFVERGDPGQTGVLPLAAEALALTGDTDRAAAVAALLERRGRELDHPWCLANAARCRGIVLRETGDLEGALGALRVALDGYESIHVPFERGRALLALGATQRQARRRRAARESLEAAHESFLALGTPLWTEQALAELGRIGGRAPSRGELTPNESRIAELVSEGKTNKEVAAVLYVTDRTVESALTQIYRKLGVRSRTELVRALRDQA